jgi:hypothetical protein
MEWDAASLARKYNQTFAYLKKANKDEPKFIAFVTNIEPIAGAVEANGREMPREFAAAYFKYYTLNLKAKQGLGDPEAGQIITETGKYLSAEREVFEIFPLSVKPRYIPTPYGACWLSKIPRRSFSNGFARANYTKLGRGTLMGITPPEDALIVSGKLPEYKSANLQPITPQIVIHEGDIICLGQTVGMVTGEKEAWVRNPVIRKVLQGHLPQWTIAS